jgi:hypothetical protein
MRILLVKLYEVPPCSRIRIKRDDDGDDPRQHPPDHRDFKEEEELFFDHIDGMYSLCKDSKGNIVHLVAWAEVEILSGNT